MKILFVNGSPNKNGNTASLAENLLKNHDYDTLNLVDYRIGCYGQSLEGDQLDEVISKLKESDIIVMGSPVYWHNICGSIRNLLDRCYGVINHGDFSGKTFYFLFQGAAPEKWMLEAGEYTMERFAKLYGMKYAGMATDLNQVNKLAKTL